ncbi:MAG: lanthionine synthetase LanC family protein, partial [Rhodospirillales bacterium]|nr:lanthionine synthetase LanC family protein [Rhodospirillales bacterium]
TSWSDSKSLELSAGGRIDHCLTQSPFSYLVDQLHSLHPGDLEKQLGFIRAALYARVVETPGPAVGRSRQGCGPEEQPLESDELRQEALKIGCQLRDQAIQAPDGSITWIALAFQPRAQRYQLQPMGYDLYSGTGGIGLFLAALKHISGEVEWRTLALGAVAEVREKLAEMHLEGADQLTDLPLGGGIGLGSVVYALVCMSELLEEEDLLADADLAARLISKDSISADREFDV